MPKESQEQKETIERVMHEFKDGELESGSGQQVKNRKQAIAIALREAGASNHESTEENARNLKRAKQKEAEDGATSAESGGRKTSKRR